MCGINVVGGGGGGYANVNAAKHHFENALFSLQKQKSNWLPAFSFKAPVNDSDCPVRKENLHESS